MTDTIEKIKSREYECFIEDHQPLPWTPGRCAGYAGRTLHLMRCKRKSGYGLGALFCSQHAKPECTCAEIYGEDPACPLHGETEPK